jgi:hypothetical protein
MTDDVSTLEHIRLGSCVKCWTMGQVLQPSLQLKVVQLNMVFRMHCNLIVSILSFDFILNCERARVHVATHQMLARMTDVCFILEHDMKCCYMWKCWTMEEVLLPLVEGGWFRFACSVCLWHGEEVRVRLDLPVFHLDCHSYRREREMTQPRC